MRALLLTWQGAWLESWANRRSFVTQVAIMAVNDAVWVLFWVFFFRRVGSLRGWDTEQVLILLAIITSGAGIVMGLLANTRHLGTLVSDGELDSVLALPAHPLPLLIVRRVNPVFVGDTVFGVILFAAVGRPTPLRIAVFVFGVACCAAILTGFIVAMGSISFFAGRSEASDLGFQASILFSTYPVDVFSGLTKVFLYAVVPAGFISTTPARLVERFDPAWAAALVGVSVLALAIGHLSFTVGLRRYESGAVWTDA